MSSSGLIYAAIAIMWAAVLIPMWLRNHDAASESRSAERFGQAMRVLSRREGRAESEPESGAHFAGETAPEYASGAEASYAADPVHEVAPPAVVPSEAPVKAAQRQPVRPPKPAQPPKPPKTLAQRRARTLGVLAGVTVVVALLSLITPLPGWAPLPVVALLVAFVVHLRVQARHRMQRRAPSSTSRGQARGATAESPAAASAKAEPATTESSVEASVVQGPSRAVVVEKKGERPSVDGVADGAVAAGGVADPDAWRPNPLPLPTYVTAPKAMRPIKVIDLTTPGAWTSGRLFDDDLADEDLLAAQVADDELDALLEQEVAPASREDGAASDGDEHGRRAVGD